MNKAISIMKTGMKGKMSSKSVDKLKNGNKLKKQVRQYTIHY